MELNVYFWNLKTEGWEFLDKAFTVEALLEISKNYPDIRVTHHNIDIPQEMLAETEAELLKAGECPTCGQEVSI